MTPQDVANNKTQINCFWCQSTLNNYSSKYIVVCDDSGEVIMIKRSGDNRPSPLVYCSSDCYVYEAHLRYCDRIAKGTFRKNFNVEFGGDTFQYVAKAQLPERWKGDQEQLIREQSREQYLGAIK